MHAGYENLNGIERDRLFAILEPVLSAHGVEPVEIIWHTDNKGWLLTLTIEKPGTTNPGEGITVDVCAEISRDLAVSLDVEDVIPHKYRLEVGSPGLERALYSLSDYARFAGHDAKLKLREAEPGKNVIRGTLRGLDDDSKILIDTLDGQRALAFETIQTGRLEFNWKKTSAQRGKRAVDARPRPSDRKSHDCSPQRSK
jgi:ribosome maturation factor RimP